MWLQPSFFCIGDLQLEHGFELVTNHRQFAEFSSASSVPDTKHVTSRLGIIADYKADIESPTQLVSGDICTGWAKKLDHF